MKKYDELTVVEQTAVKKLVCDGQGAILALLAIENLTIENSEFVRILMQMAYGPNR